MTCGISFVSLLIEVLEFLLAELLMTCQIEVAAMGHLEFTEVGAGEGEAVLDVERTAALLRVMGQFVGVVSTHLDLVAGESH